MYYCPICGSELEGVFRMGEICDCCFNECSFNDDLFLLELEICFGLDLLTKLYPQYFNLMNKENHLHDSVDVNLVRTLLRAKWCLNGYPYGYQNVDEEDVSNFKYLTKKEAKKQLQNINVDLDEFEKLFK
jgi:hypothetical protein